MRKKDILITLLKKNCLLSNILFLSIVAPALYSSNVYMDVEEYLVHKPKTQIYSDIRINNHPSSQRIPEADRLTCNSSKKMANCLFLSQIYKENSFELSPKEREKALDVNLYIAKNTLDLWVKWKYFQRVQDLLDLNAMPEIDVFH
jgi:hypothetical protein